ncbi:cell wall-active antibiotics response protein LiaF [Bacillus niameyensis]|uniref:cell wall-active antibiotics response protein LiaF n=1 Tax=Bacillus niameyensis TaxID=1522308 RepID=UPI0007841E89|nr:cell wall-active antibiotics response protein LiaF [Bacillus niameyensis]
MKKMSKTSVIGWIFLITAIGVGLEILFNWRLFIPLLIGSFLIYQGRYLKKKQNTYFIIGIILIAIPVLSSGFLKLIVIFAVVYGLYEYNKTKKHPEKIVVQTVEPGDTSSHLHKKIPYFKNSFIGSKQKNNGVYEWDDINIQCGFGDTIIDLSMTMLPHGENVVLVRSFIGNIKILVPFDAAVVVNHSSISGKMKIFDEEMELFNSNIIYAPDSAQESIRTIKIMTNVMIGDIEVKRI